MPGMTIVCGDSHTATHGAFGALAFGIGTSEVEHVLATQTLPQNAPGTMAVNVEGELPDGVTAKDLILAIIGRIGTGGGIGSVIEYRGPAIRGLSMEGRMTVCNMSIEAGAKAGLIAPDETTFAYLEGRTHAPKGKDWEAALEHWRSLPTDEGAAFDKSVTIDATALRPFVSWGTNPGQVVELDQNVPDPASFADPGDRDAARRALEYMGLTAGTPLRDVPVQTVFIGSCTNSRIEDLRAAAAVAEGHQVRSGVRAMVVPGSFAVKDQAEAEGLDRSLHRGRLRLARARLLDVPGHEPRQAGARRAVGLDLQPQLRGPTGQGRPHPPGVPRRRRRHRHRRNLRRPPRPGLRS